MSNTLFWITIILLIVILALIVWLLFTGGGSVEIVKQKLDQPCKQTSDCNTGLVCDINDQSGKGVCKVASGGVCSANTECAEGLECKNGVCMVKGGDLNEPCPCNKGFTCINKVCKAVNGEPCKQDSDCADGRCCGGVCLAYDYPSCGSSDCSDYSNSNSNSKYDYECTSFTDSKYNKKNNKHSKDRYDDISFSSEDDSHYSYCRSIISGKDSDCNCSSMLNKSNNINNNKSSSSLRYSTYTLSNSLY